MGKWKDEGEIGGSMEETGQERKRQKKKEEGRENTEKEAGEVKMRLEGERRKEEGTVKKRE